MAVHLSAVLCLNQGRTDRAPNVCVTVASCLTLALSLMGLLGDSWGCLDLYVLSLCLFSWQDSLWRVFPVPGWIVGVGWTPYLTASQPSHKASRKGFLDTSAEVKPQVLFLQIAELPGSVSRTGAWRLSSTSEPSLGERARARSWQCQHPQQDGLHSWPLSLPWHLPHRKDEAAQTDSALSWSQPGSMTANLG